MIFTILSHVPLMVVESLVCSEPPQADSLLISVFTYFALNSGEFQ